MPETSHNYGRYVITAYESPQEGFTAGHTFRVSDGKSIFGILKVSIVLPNGLEYLVAQKPERTLEEYGLQAVHGLLDFGLFEKTKEYHLKIDNEGIEWLPPLHLAAPDFGDDLDMHIQYHILSALDRTRRSLTTEYERVRLDPEGVCIVLDIQRNQFEYNVGLLGEGRLIKTPETMTFTMGLFRGDFYLTGKGSQTLRKMTHPPKPEWKTKQASEEAQKRVPEIIETIENWTPKQRFRTEESYQGTLAEHLEKHGIDAPEQQGATLVDILAAHSIGIEIKVNPDRSEYDRLSGQIMRHLEAYGNVIVFIVRPDKRDLLDEYMSRFADDSRVRFTIKG